jgi:hypothetical protein
MRWPYPGGCARLTGGGRFGTLGVLKSHVEKRFWHKRAARAGGFLVLAALALWVSGCAATKKARGREAAAPAVFDSFREERPAGGFHIVDYQGRSRALALPAWVSLYLAGGIQAVEQQSDGGRGAAPGPYAGKYVFVSVQKSGNLAALLQWKTSFAEAPDFSAMVFPRIYRRVVRNLGVNPEVFYGSFFGVFLKAAANAAWTDVALADSVWLVLQSAGDGGGGEAAEINMVLSLAVVEKHHFERELSRMADKIPRDREQTRDQRAAVARLKSAFFDFF